MTKWNYSTAWMRKFTFGKCVLCLTKAPKWCLRGKPWTSLGSKVSIWSRSLRMLSRLFVVSSTIPSSSISRSVARRNWSRNRCVRRWRRYVSDPRPTSTTTSSSSSTPSSSSTRATRCAPTFSSVAAVSSSRSRVRCFCSALPTTWRSMPR